MAQPKHSTKISEYDRHEVHMQSTDPQFPSAMVNGKITAIDRENRVLTIARDAIGKWQRPARNRWIFQLADNYRIYKV